MGIVESSWRKQVRVGEEVDITLIGGREMRGRVLDIAEDGLLLGEENLERPIAFAGIATFALTRCVRREKSAPQGETHAGGGAAGAGNGRAARRSSPGGRGAGGPGARGGMDRPV